MRRIWLVDDGTNHGLAVREIPICVERAERASKQFGDKRIGGRGGRGQTIGDKRAVDVTKGCARVVQDLSEQG